MAELSLWLDSYDDIYSDFDARTLLKRRVSEDFIHELGIAFRRREENTDLLILQVPVAVRNTEDERLITERLKNHFNHEYEHYLQAVKKGTRRNIAFLCISIIIMSVSVVINIPGNQRWAHLTPLRILLEPAGWFFFWNSLEYFFFARKSAVQKTSFWQTVSGWKILFKSY